MKITIVGAGNLGSHLFHGFISVGIEVVQVYSRDIKKALGLVKGNETEAIDDLSLLNQDVDLVLIAVHDDAIPAVATEVRKYLKHQLVAHTAGSVSSLVLHHQADYGVFWPLQSFSKGRDVDWGEIPILITGHTSEAIQLLTEAAQRLSDRVEAISDQQRLALHLAAAMANNFSNHMFAIADKIAAQHGLDFDLLKPLIRETAEKVMTLSPQDAQTGPAQRGDEDTMSKHRELLIEHPEIMRLYNTISESIIELKQS